MELICGHLRRMARSNGEVTTLPRENDGDNHPDLTATPPGKASPSTRTVVRYRMCEGDVQEGSALQALASRWIFQRLLHIRAQPHV